MELVINTKMTKKDILAELLYYGRRINKIAFKSMIKNNTGGVSYFTTTTRKAILLTTLNELYIYVNKNGCSENEINDARLGYSSWK